MILWMSGEIMVDSYIGILNLIEPAINQCLKEKDYGGGLIEWDYLAMILDSHGPPYKEIKRYRKNRKEVEFRLKIDHDTFLHASKYEQVRLVSESLLRSIKLMPEIGVKEVDFSRLEADVSKCLAEVQGKVKD